MDPNYSKFKQCWDSKPAFIHLQSEEGISQSKAAGELIRRQKAMKARCSGLEFYLRPLFRALLDDTVDEAGQRIDNWLAKAPRPLQRAEALRDAEEDETPNLILFGSCSGTGKTTCAYELIWINALFPSGYVHHDQDQFYPTVLTGHEFTRKASASAARNGLEELHDELNGVSVLVLDDLDKRANGEGKWSPTCQQSFLDLIEHRTTADEENITVLTMNSIGAEFESKFDDDVGPYVMRRLRERFRAINFDVIV